MSASGRPATIIVACVLDGGDALVQPAEFIDVETRHRAERHDAQADLVADDDDLAARVGQARRRSALKACDVAAGVRSVPSAGQSRLASHSVRQSIRTQ